MNTQEFLSNIQNWYKISNMLKTHDYSDILETVSELLNISTQQLEKRPMGGYTKYHTVGAYKETLYDLIVNIYHYDKVYEMLADDQSKIVFIRLMQFRLVPLIDFIEKAFDPVNPQYFDKEIIECTENEVFVDCGGFIGDTAESFISCYKKYKKIYVFEPSCGNIEKCRDNLNKYENVIISKCGVGEKSETLYMSNSSASSSFMSNQENGEDVQIISLDEDIDEPVTFIKMDVECFEIPALLGSRKHIQNDNPKLAICTYHVVSDMWEIPELISIINPNYKFYYRHYRKDQPWETVLYAVPF